VTPRIYIVENASQGDNEVKYWGTVFQEVDDTTESRFTTEIQSSLQLYRRAYLLVAVNSSTTFVARLTLWIPREYRFTFAIVRVFQY